MENIGVGLLLMVVGMCTVFLILLIVIWISQFLISVVNKMPLKKSRRRSLLQVGLLQMPGQWMLLRPLWKF